MKAEHKERPHLATKKAIMLAKADIIERLSKWRTLQAIHMPDISQLLLATQPSEIEDEHLFLPSYFSEQDRIRYSLTHLAHEEMQLRQGQASECILQLRWIVKTLSVMHGQKIKNELGQKRNMRANYKLHSVELTRNRMLEVYNTSHHALRTLGYNPDDLNDQFPLLTLSDLYRKSTVMKRQRGDTYHSDGRLWMLGGRQSNNQLSITTLMPPSSIDDNSLTRQEAFHNQVPEVDHKKLWNPTIGLSPTELEQWEHEGE
jgi:hypothetical protein